MMRKLLFLSLVFVFLVSVFGVSGGEYVNKRFEIGGEKNYRSSINLDGSSIVYHTIRDSDETGSDVYVYNVDTNKSIPIAKTIAGEANPKISGNYIVWQHKEVEGWDVALHNIETSETKIISNSGFFEMNPKICDDIVYWIGGIELSGYYSKVFGYSISKDKLISVEPSGFYKVGYLCSNGEKIAYAKRDWRVSKSYDLFVFDIESNERIIIGRGKHDQVPLFMSEKYLLWLDNSDCADRMSHFGKLKCYDFLAKKSFTVDESESCIYAEITEDNVIVYQIAHNMRMMQTTKWDINKVELKNPNSSTTITDNASGMFAITNDWVVFHEKDGHKAYNMTTEQIINVDELSPCYFSASGGTAVMRVGDKLKGIKFIQEETTK